MLNNEKTTKRDFLLWTKMIFYIFICITILMAYMFIYRKYAEHVIYNFYITKLNGEEVKEIVDSSDLRKRLIYNDAIINGENIFVNSNIDSIHLSARGSALVWSDFLNIPQNQFYYSINGKKQRANKPLVIYRNGLSIHEYNIDFWLSLIWWQHREKQNSKIYIYWLDENEFAKLKTKND